MSEPSSSKLFLYIYAGRLNVVFPTAAEGLVNRDQCRARAGLALRELVLGLIQHPFRIEHGQKIRRPILVTLAGEICGDLACLHRLVQKVAPGLFTAKVYEGVFHLFKRGEDGAFIKGKRGFVAGIGCLDA